METLFIGNVAYWTTESLKEAFPEDFLAVVSDGCEEVREKKFSSYSMSVSDDRLEELFANTSFGRVIYISRYLTYKGKVQGELEELRKVLRLCITYQVSQVVYLASEEVCEGVDYGRTVILRAAEELCRHYMESAFLPVKIIRCPYLVGGNGTEGYWEKVLDALSDGQPWIFEETESQKANFISISDLNQFFIRFFEDWKEDVQEYTIHGYCRETFGDAAAWLRKQFPEADIRVQGIQKETEPALGMDVVRSRFGWFARLCLTDSLEEILKARLSRETEKPGLRALAGKLLAPGSRVVVAGELVTGGLLVEWLNRLMHTSVQFQMIDVRLLFVVCMASMYGVNIGLAAAGIEMLSLAWQYYLDGMNGTLLFFEPSNWLPFILYMSTGAICGYLRGKKEDEIGFLKKEQELLKEKYTFLTRLYEEALEFKNQYKKQIIGSRDSFGRIFDVVRRLDTMLPEKIFGEAVSVLEDVLNTKTIAIYSIHDPGATFARLEVCSQQISRSVKKSLELSVYQECLDVLDRGEVWFNREMKDGFPVYMTGVKIKGNLTMVIMVCRVEFNQIGMYYANLIRILSGLIESAFTKAWEYKNAVREEIYLGDTVFIYEEFFKEQLKIREDMYEKQMVSYRLLQIRRNGKSLEEMDVILRTKMRNNDIAGLCADGNIYILMSQVDENSEEIILRRFTGMGLECRFVSGIEESEEGKVF